MTQDAHHTQRRSRPSRNFFRLGVPWFVFLLAVHASPAGDAETVMVVQVRNCVIRSGPSFLSSPSGNLAYSDSVSITEQNGPWRRISSADSKRSGWVHVTALTPPRAEMRQGTGQASTRVSSGEVALAGRGLDAEAESTLRQKNKALDYASVDRLEAMLISTDDVLAFALKGELLPTEKR